MHAETSDAFVMPTLSTLVPSKGQGDAERAFSLSPKCQGSRVGSWQDTPFVMRAEVSTDVPVAAAHRVTVGSSCEGVRDDVVTIVSPRRTCQLMQEVDLRIFVRNVMMPAIIGYITCSNEQLRHLAGTEFVHQGHGIREPEHPGVLPGLAPVCSLAERAELCHSAQQEYASGRYYSLCLHASRYWPWCEREHFLLCLRYVRVSDTLMGFMRVLGAAATHGAARVIQQVCRGGVARRTLGEIRVRRIEELYLPVTHPQESGRHVEPDIIELHRDHLLQRASESRKTVLCALAQRSRLGIEAVQKECIMTTTLFTKEMASIFGEIGAFESGRLDAERHHAREISAAASCREEALRQHHAELSQRLPRNKTPNGCPDERWADKPILEKRSSLLDAVPPSELEDGIWRESRMVHEWKRAIELEHNSSLQRAIESEERLRNERFIESHLRHQQGRLIRTPIVNMDCGSQLPAHDESFSSRSGLQFEKSDNPSTSSVSWKRPATLTAAPRKLPSVRSLRSGEKPSSLAHLCSGQDRTHNRSLSSESLTMLRACHKPDQCIVPGCPREAARLSSSPSTRPSLSLMPKDSDALFEMNRDLLSLREASFLSFRLFDAGRSHRSRPSWR